MPTLSYSISASNKSLKMVYEKKVYYEFCFEKMIYLLFLNDVYILDIFVVNV